MILAIDPGCTESAYVVLDGERLVRFGHQPNDDVLDILRCQHVGPQLVIESVASYGMAVGAEVFETCVFVGRCVEAWHERGEVDRLYRLDIKLHLCRSPRATDANIRQALIDRYGGSAAVGRKKSPGPLYGVSGDVWAALAVACAWQDGVRSKIKGDGAKCPERAP